VKAKQSIEALPKTSFALSRCKISNAMGFGDLLSRSAKHIGAQDGDYGGGAKVGRGKTQLICRYL
jgi:hypothetical protein